MADQEVGHQAHHQDIDREEIDMKGRVGDLVMGIDEDSAQRPRVMGGL